MHDTIRVHERLAVLEVRADMTDRRVSSLEQRPTCAPSSTKPPSITVSADTIKLLTAALIPLIPLLIWRLTGSVEMAKAVAGALPH